MYSRKPKRKNKNQDTMPYNQVRPVNVANKSGSSQYKGPVKVTHDSGKSSGQYQAPHQDEPEDLTDDLAPTMAGQGSQQPGSQQRAAENKLNFKFQRSVSKNADWSEYQSKFRRIGGGSPEPAPAPAQAGDKSVKQEPNLTINNDANNTKSLTQTPAVAAPQPTTTGQVKTGTNSESQPAPQPMPVSRFDMMHKPGDTHTNSGSQPPAAVAQPQKPVSRFDMMHKPGDTRMNSGQPPAPAQQPARAAPPALMSIETRPMQPAGHQYLPIYPHAIFGPYDNYPKGIPKSFLMQEHRFDPPQAPQQPSPAYDSYDYSIVPDNPAQPTAQIDLPSWILPSQAPQEPQPEPKVGANPPIIPMFIQNEPIRPYSPTDIYADTQREEESHEGSESPDLLQSSQKRQSAFSRLGPLAQPKKPKLTINLTLNKEQAVREVVDETDADFRFVPVHLRKDILESEDETVRKYLPFWPWKKNLKLRKTVSARFSKSVMILEQEQMETGYEKDSLFIQVSVKGYPKTWNKENVLDAILDHVKGKTFIPCFVEFTPTECKFLVIRCRAALLAIHKVGFCIRKDDVELAVSISLTDTSLNQIDLIPRLVLRKRLMTMYDGESKLDLTEFFAEKDVSHFVYFPLNRVTNQLELSQLQSAVAWEYLTDLNLSNNRLTTLDGFDLNKTTPRLKRLDLSHNYLDRVTVLLPLRDLPLRVLRLEGNPLCHDYIDSAHYVKVVRMMFSEIRELDGVRITLKGSLPPMRRNHCPAAAVPVADKFLETFFPLLEAPPEARSAVEDMYDKDAQLSVTFRYKLRYGSAYRYFRNLFLRARSLEEREMESVDGAGAITALLLKWPAIEHDRYAMTVDVIYHDDFTTILRIGGILKLTAETLAEDEHLLAFTRTVVLHTRNGAEYKIHNEMLYWDLPCEEVTNTAFNVTTVRARRLTLKLDSPPDEDLKSKLVDIFVKLADIDKKRGARCLEMKNWDLRSALEYYVTLLKLDDLSALSPPKERTPAPQAS